MHNYNEDFFEWLEKVRKLEPKSHEDLPIELQEEFEKLMFLAPVPFLKIYGEDPNAMAEFLLVVLNREECYATDGSPLNVTHLEQGKVFTSPVNGLVAQPMLSAEDELGRHFVFFYCDWRGPHLGEAAAVFDAIHEPLWNAGASEDDLPDVYFIYITDYDIGHNGQKVMRMDYDPVPERTDEEWRARGCDPRQHDPDITKWHTIFFNATKVS